MSKSATFTPYQLGLEHAGLVAKAALSKRTAFLRGAIVPGEPGYYEYKKGRNDGGDTTFGNQPRASTGFDCDAAESGWGGDDY